MMSNDVKRKNSKFKKLSKYRENLKKIPQVHNFTTNLSHYSQKG